MRFTSPEHSIHVNKSHTTILDKVLSLRTIELVTHTAIKDLDYLKDKDATDVLNRYINNEKFTVSLFPELLCCLFATLQLETKITYMSQIVPKYPHKPQAHHMTAHIQRILFRGIGIRDSQNNY